MSITTALFILLMGWSLDWSLWFMVPACIFWAANFWVDLRIRARIATLEAAKLEAEASILEAEAERLEAETEVTPKVRENCFEQFPHVGEAFIEYTQNRLANHPGNQGIPLKLLLIEFARWHGTSNLDRGILRDSPPPVTLITPPTTPEC